MIRENLKIHGPIFFLYLYGLQTHAWPACSQGRAWLQLLRQRYYYATWKADGTRTIAVPCSDYHGVHHYTLLDGEMVVDTFRDGKNWRQARWYLVYDLLAINGESVTHLPFSERWNILNKDVIKPRNDEKKSQRSSAFYLLSALGKVSKDLIPSLSHEADGLIFQGWDDSYKKNSVDFLLDMGKDGRRMLFLYEDGKNKLMEGYSVEFRGDGWNNTSSYRGKIVECTWDREKKVWVGMRIRVDKNTPNRVIKSINDNITEEVLLQEIKEIIHLPVYTERIQMDSQAAEHHRHGNRKA
ncbi:hypothetical protein AALP_AA8G264400 [Arabis alpina]|uniref:ATP-dependent DNA ligase family profile domain-containing protein n=1 Tax=Arabis alpina TaxID=50452 RepID=A0A087G9K7_ARAAL|nr:hypothetical protein AALP_AA8G264400 [Arabis alpina]